MRDPRAHRGVLPALAAVCNAMRRISQFVEGVMADAPAQVFSAFSAGVYIDSSDGPTTENMLACMAKSGDPFCRRP